MAQNFEHFLVPQKNRRNKVRFTTQVNREQQTAPSTPLFFPQTHINPSMSPPFPSLQNLKNLSYQPLTGQGLSLSLSYQLGRQRCNAVSLLGDFLKPTGEMTSSVPFGPFTGYATIMKSSRFLKPAQQFLDDLCGVNCGIIDFSSDCLSESDVMRETVAFSDQVDYLHHWEHSKLILMLNEVYRRYKLYCQQMQSVVASFQTVAGLRNAAPYICLAFRTVLKHFTGLKNVLFDQIQFAGKTFDGEVTESKIPRFFTAQSLQTQNPALNSNFLQNPVWRSQRGLPDNAVAVLKTWLFEHFLHPYPTDSEKQALAQQTGLSRTQVSNWFINARVRLWKPMVEEVHMLESQQAHVPLEAVNRNASLPKDFSMDKLLSTPLHQETEDIRPKRPRNELPDVCGQRQERRNIYTNKLSNYQTAGVSGSNGVSLALGLHQNDVNVQPWHLPMCISQNDQSGNDWHDGFSLNKQF